MLENNYIMTSFMFIIFGALVMFMTSGFAMVEAGLECYPEFKRN